MAVTEGPAAQADGARPKAAPDWVNLSDMEFWAAPYEDREAGFARLRAEWPLAYYPEPASPLPAGPGYWAVTRHADVVEASRNPEVFCSGQGATHVPDFPTEFAEFFGSMIEMDDPRHHRLRRIVSRAFTPRMIKKFEQDVETAAARVVDDLAATGTGDFVTDVAARLPLKVICDMMGVPEKDYGFVLDRTNTIIGVADPEYVPEDADHLTVLLTAGGELAGLLTELGAYRTDNPADDVISALVNANIDGERLTADELASFFILLVVAGNETTRNAISHGLRLLTANPDQRALWLGDFERHTPTAVEEVVRLASPVVWMRRTATCDTVLGGQPIDAGDKLLLYYWSANRDAAVFADPERFDITRDPNPHVGYGGPGPHFCLGAHLARREITIMFRELLGRYPAVRMTGPPERLRSSFINGIKHMPYEI
ncbi:cytochrome P450 [Yinghuangia seranimata]|uniref:cytochrome P450 n=1 Tax=Yinghuangia seranimata TaxID=408067 RepID=UPI00248B39D4|nr:cytochrome P450 [Yinghuangia seranimata]MDI2130258.1 cytochrome P450 [Yinghuangia seranimata]